MRISAARSRTRLDDGETSIAFSFRARPFMHKLSAAWKKRSKKLLAIVIKKKKKKQISLPLHEMKRRQIQYQ